MNLSKQYNNFAKSFSAVHDIGENSNRDNRLDFYSHVAFIKPGMKLLDLACGDGLDLIHYKNLGAEVYGVDSSEELIDIAKKRLPNNDIRVGEFEKLPYENNFFDAVLSKYSIQTSKDLQPVFAEILRVLKPGGILLFLVTHPFRTYFEKRNPKVDYFKQEISQIAILNNSITVNEPSHTMNEYLNDFLFTNFDVQEYHEAWDAAADQIDGRKYPGYFILKAKKRI